MIQSKTPICTFCISAMVGGQYSSILFRKNLMLPRISFLFFPFDQSSSLFYCITFHAFLQEVLQDRESFYFIRKENVWSSPINDSGGGGSGLLSTPSENLRCVQSPLRLILFSAWISTGFRALTESCISLSSFCYSFFFALPNGIFLLP